MQVTTKIEIPPGIVQQFREDLLITSCPKLKDDELTLIELFRKVISKQKYTNDQIEKLKKEFLGLYESIQKKKEDPQRKIRNRTEESFYFVRSSNRRSEKLFVGLRHGRAFANSLFFRNNM